MGTNGSDGWSLMVTADGTNRQDAVIAQGGSEQISLPNGVSISGAVDLPEASIGRGILAAGAGLSVIGRSSTSSRMVGDIAQQLVMWRCTATEARSVLALSRWNSPVRSQVCWH